LLYLILILKILKILSEKNEVLLKDLWNAEILEPENHYRPSAFGFSACAGCCEDLFAPDAGDGGDYRSRRLRKDVASKWRDARDVCFGCESDARLSKGARMDRQTGYTARKKK
jgi:hypothetical protein